MGGTGRSLTLDELLHGAAADVPGVTAASSPDAGRTWSHAGRAFASVSADGSVAEFALDPAVAAAAVRTPDAVPSGRGPGWVRFSPHDLDDHAADRALAWFASAYRRAGPRN
jgi:hypothetical protein